MATDADVVAKLGSDVVHRLLELQSTVAPIVSLYLGVPDDPGRLHAGESSLHGLLKEVRALARSAGLSHDARMSLRDDATRLARLEGRVRELQARGVAVFSCSHDGVYEELVLPRRVRDRIVMDATPYIRPLLAVLDESHRYCVVVVDREKAWLWDFFMGVLEEEEKVRDRALRQPNFAGGWQGYREHTTHNKAEGLTRRHYRGTANTVERFLARTGAELLIIGGHEETVAEFRPFLPPDLHNRVAGTFVVDPTTMTPGQVRERADEVVDAYEREEERRLAADALERVAAGGLAAEGVEWCLLAVNEEAVQLLLIDDERVVPGVACDTCGWLGLEGDVCPVCSSATRTSVDVIDEMAAIVIDTHGRVEHVAAETELAEQTMAALLRFPVPRPS